MKANSNLNITKSIVNPVSQQITKVWINGDEVEAVTISDLVEIDITENGEYEIESESTDTMRKVKATVSVSDEASVLYEATFTNILDESDVFTAFVNANDEDDVTKLWIEGSGSLVKTAFTKDELGFIIDGHTYSIAY